VINKDGSTHYADKAKDGSYKCIVRTKAQNRYKELLINTLLSETPSLKIELSESITPSSVNSNEKPIVSENKAKYTGIINRTASKHKVDVRLVHAVIQAESSYNADAKSSAGAVGLMQLMPKTAKKYGVSDRSNPDQNIDGGTRYLKDLLTLFNSDMSLAVAAYNAGENAVIKYNNKIPPYPETRNYVKTVLALYSQ